MLSQLQRSHWVIWGILTNNASIVIGNLFALSDGGEQKCSYYARACAHVLHMLALVLGARPGAGPPRCWTLQYYNLSCLFSARTRGQTP